MATRKSHSRPLRLSLLAIALAATGTTYAQDSGIGVDLHFGNGLDASGVDMYGCDANGITWLSGDRHRTPTGFLYQCVPARGAYPAVDNQSGWRSLGTFRIGYVHLTGDENNVNWRKYNDYDEAAIGFMDLALQRPADGSYVDFRASRVNQHNQYFRAVGGQAGRYRVQAFGRTTSHVVSGNARSIWNGVGTDQLTLASGLTAGGSTPAQVAAVSAATRERVMRVTRDKFGVGIQYAFNRQWSGYLNASHEKREGARPFGATFGFNLAPVFQDNGGIYEIPRPIDDSTVNFNTGLRFVGSAWRMEFGYSGSFFRKGYDSYTYQAPYALSVSPFFDLPPFVSSLFPTSGRTAYEPENDAHKLTASFTRKFGTANEFSLTASTGRMRQDDELLPPTNCQGQVGMANFPLPGAVIDCANWNTTAALSRKTADLSVDSRRLHGRLVMRPSESLTWQVNANYNAQDYKGDYESFNPLTGQWGYIIADGAFGSLVPFEMGIYDAGTFQGVRIRIRNMLFDKTTYGLATALDWRPNSSNTLGLKLSHERTEREAREVGSVRDAKIEASWNFKPNDWITLRSNYSYLDRSGNDYVSDPYEHYYSSGLPIYTPAPSGAIAPPHTVDAMRKFDLSDSQRHQLSIRSAFALPHNMTLSVSGKLNRNDYDAQIGRRGYDSHGIATQWEWQPNTATAVSAWAGWDNTKLAMANVNDPLVQFLSRDDRLGGENYTHERRWWIDEEDRTLNAGLNLNTRFRRAQFDFSWSWINSNTSTKYRYATPEALTFPGLGPLTTGQFPDAIHRVNSLSLGVTFPLAERLNMRLFDIYQRGKLDDWHYRNFGNTQVYDHRVYTDGGPESYSVNMVGLMLEYKL